MKLDVVESCWIPSFKLFRNREFSAGIYLLKDNNGNIWTTSENCLKLTTKIPEWRQWRRPGVSFLLTVNRFHKGVFIVDFKQVNVDWVGSIDWKFIHCCLLLCTYFAMFMDRSQISLLILTEL